MVTLFAVGFSRFIANTNTTHRTRTAKYNYSNWPLAVLVLWVVFVFAMNLENPTANRVTIAIVILICFFSKNKTHYAIAAGVLTVVITELSNTLETVVTPSF